MGQARKERVPMFGTDQRITSGPAVKRPRLKAGYMTAPERFADSQIPLAPRAPSIHDPSPTSTVHRSNRSNFDLYWVTSKVGSYRALMSETATRSLRRRDLSSERE